MTLYLDTETTGLSATDEIVEIAIIDDQNRVMLNTLVKPQHHKYWPNAQRIHGISPVMVETAPTYPVLTDTIETLVAGQDVVIYNKAYDCQYVGKELTKAHSVHCCMLAFARHYGQWDCYHGNYRWQNLKTASDYVLHHWQGDAHRALADVQATKSVWEYLTVPEIRQQIDERRQA